MEASTGRTPVVHQLTHRGLSTLERDPGGEALVATLVTVDIDNTQGPVRCSLRADLHHTQVPAVVF